MFELSFIQDTVLQVADAITAAMEIETEIVDHTLKIIGGTGRYVGKIGMYEEEGDLESPYFYSMILQSGREYVSLDAQRDALYRPLEGELAEIACPIQIDGRTIGIIGLVAFTAEQQRKISQKAQTLLNFMRRMADLLAGKVIESQSNRKLAGLLESMPDGLLAVDGNGRIFSGNQTAEQLLGLNRRQLSGLAVEQLFPQDPFFHGGEETAVSLEKEIRYRKGSRDTSFYFTRIAVPEIGAMYIFRDAAMMTRNVRRIAFNQGDTTFEDIYGRSRGLQEAKKRALQVAESNSTVLITGESGTGKELFARAIHSASLRREEIFVSINCGAIPETLLESELFGYEKGAFTGAARSGKPGKFELAENGTIFLDEIGDMPLHLQVKLLHVLQNRRIERVGGTRPILIDVRIIAATNRNLEEMIGRNEFREDLYFRLNVIPLHIPPLRERREDIEPLLSHSLERFNRALGKTIRGFSAEALEALFAWRWPGNIRELENVVEYAVNMETDPWIRLQNLPEKLRRQADSALSGGTLKERTDVFHRQVIAGCLAETGSDFHGKRRAAELLGISESTLYRRMRELNMGRDGRPGPLCTG